MGSVLLFWYTGRFLIDCVGRSLLQAEALTAAIIDGIEDIKGRDIVVIDVKGRSSVTDTLVICSGNSRRHVVSIAENVVTALKARNVTILGVEGADAGEWVLVDAGDAIVHVMQDDTRDFYQLERLWADNHSTEEAA